MRERYDKYSRSANYRKKYGHEWVKIRERYVSGHPLCEMCLKEGKVTPVEEVRKSNKLVLCLLVSFTPK